MKQIFSILIVVFAIFNNPGMAFGEGGGKLLSRKVIVSMETSAHNMAKIAAWGDSWREELGDGGLGIYALRGSVSWRMELYKMVKDRALSDKLCRAMGINGIWNDSLPRIPRGHVALVDSFADGGVVSKMVDIRDFEPSAAFYEAVGEDISAFNNFCRSQLTTVDSTIYLGMYFWGGPSALAALMHRFQMQASGCDISLWAPAHWGDSLSSGHIYLHDIERLVPYRNTLVVVTLTGQQLLALMEQTYVRRFKTMKNEHSDLLRSRTPCYLHGQFQGLAHSLDVSKAKGLKVKLNRDATYKVAMNSFMARELETIDTVGDYRLLLTKWIIGNNLEESIVQSLETHPHPWVRTAAQREELLLNN